MSKVYMSKLNFYLSRTMGHRFWCTLNLLLIIVMMIIMIIIKDASGQSVLRKRKRRTVFGKMLQFDIL